MNFRQQTEERVIWIEQVIRNYLPAEEGWNKTVAQAINYSILAGGKRLRPMLMLETYRLFGGTAPAIEPFLAAIEMIHTYSLVHDDLPAMDNDEYRRGRKTTHIVYGEAMAILAGDGLLNLAYETAAKAFDAECELQKVARAMQILADKAGIFGMVGGQTADIEAEDCENIAQERLFYIHEHKTAALIEASMMIGAVLAGADQDQVDKVEKIAHDIGIAFQIQDDILDVEGNAEQLGKSTGSDAKNHKTTYVTLTSLEEAKAMNQELSEDALELLQELNGKNDFLRVLIIGLITRDR